jgi:hypothetical protein
MSLCGSGSSFFSECGSGFSFENEWAMPIGHRSGSDLGTGSTLKYKKFFKGKLNVYFKGK